MTGRSISWSDLVGKLVGSVLVVCVLALIVTGTVRLAVELWP